MSNEIIVTEPADLGFITPVIPVPTVPEESKADRKRRLAREWSARNPEKMREKWLRRVAKDPEKIKQKNRSYNELNKELVAAKKKAARSTPEAKEKERIRRKAYYEANKAKEAAKMAAWYQENRDKQIAYAKEYASRPAVAEAIKAKRKDYCAKNRDRRSAWFKKWYLANRDYLRQYVRNKIDSDPDFYRKQWEWRKKCPKRRAEIAVRARLRDLMSKRKIYGKRAETHVLIGCSLDALVAHLESQFKPGMNWSNYTFKGWHIDHKKPCALFDLSDPEQQKQCFHYTNLQPLWWWENLAKSDKYDGPV